MLKKFCFIFLIILVSCFQLFAVNPTLLSGYTFLEDTIIGKSNFRRYEYTFSDFNIFVTDHKNKTYYTYYYIVGDDGYIYICPESEDDFFHADYIKYSLYTKKEKVFLDLEYNNKKLKLRDEGSFRNEAEDLALTFGAASAISGVLSKFLPLPHPKEEIPKEVKSEIQKGGLYKDLVGDSHNGLYEIHHMPANSSNTIDRGMGPSIKMLAKDHHETASWGHSREAMAYKAKQAELINNGHIYKAWWMDVEDIVGKFGTKYIPAIAKSFEALRLASTLI